MPDPEGLEAIYYRTQQRRDRGLTSLAPDLSWIYHILSARADDRRGAPLVTAMPSPHLARWFRVYAKILLWIVLASVVPPALLLTLSYYQTLRQAEADLNDAVTQGVQRVDSLLKTADLTLANLAADIQHLEQLNDEKALRLVQRVAYKEPRFREVGIINAQGSLVLTSLGIGEFQVHYQPILDIQTGYCVGAEALIRWCHPQEGLLLPSTFIGIVEATGLINDMSIWVCQQVMQDQALLEAQYPDVYISINISPVQLNSGDIEEVILTLMTHPHSYPGRIVVEVTEAALVEDTKTNALSAIARLHSLGLAIALDDFGTGYSNLGYLHKFHLDYLKIDRIFVTAIKQSSRTSAVVDAVIDLGRNLDVELIAEGIETEEQLQFLKRRGVRYAQGYLLAHPMPIKAFQVFLAQNRKVPFALKT